MPVDVFPEFAPPKVEIQTICIGLSAEEVEQLVTVPIEQSLAGIEGLETIRSKSVIQLSQVVLLFKPGTNELEARQLVAERLAQITPSLPTWAAPPVMLQPLSATSRVMKIGLSSDTVSQIDMSMISYWTIRPRLLSVPGVANIAIWGEQLHMLTVQAVPDKLVEHGVALTDVMNVVSETLDDGLLQFNPGNFTGTGGYVDTPNQRFVIRHVPPVVGVEDLAHVTVPGRDGVAVPLTEVVELVEDHQPLIGEAVINDGPGVMLIVEKFPWANTLDVTRGVEEALGELTPALPGISVDHEIFRPASFIEQALHNLSNALLLGSALVFIILIVFLFEWRTALISLVAIPLSLMAAAMVLYVRDVTINTMILAGFVISVGVVVDDAIIDVENITRRLRQARLEGSTRSTASIVL
jgi:Cu/Ag efflux pump CusA